MKMCTVLPIPSFAGTLSCPTGTFIVNLRRADRQTLLRGHRRRDGIERVGVREMRPHSDLQKSGIDNADLRTEGVYSLREYLSRQTHRLDQGPAVRRGFTPSANVFPQASRMPMSLLVVGRIPLLNPAFLNPNTFAESKSAILRTEGFTACATCRFREGKV